jgi:MraZ protein
VFRGSSNHTIDAKGRIIIPARFREPIKNGDPPSLMLTKLDGGLRAYPMEDWQAIEADAHSRAKKSETMRRFLRVTFGGAFEIQCDKQDRILVPPTLREYAGLEKDIVLVGMRNHFQIWSKPKWEEENNTLEKEMQREEVRNEIADLGL